MNQQRPRSLVARKEVYAATKVKCSSTTPSVFCLRFTPISVVDVRKSSCVAYLVPGIGLRYVLLLLR